MWWSFKKPALTTIWLMSVQNPKYLHEDQQTIRKLISWTNSWLVPLHCMRLPPFPGSSWPVLPCTGIYHRLAPSFHLPLASGNSPVPTCDCSKWALTALPAKCSSDTLGGTHCKQEKSSTLSFQIPPFKLLSAPVTVEHLMLSMFVAPSCRRKNLADMEWRDVGLEDSRGWDCLFLFSAYHHVPKGHSPQERFLIHYIQNEPD